MTHYIKLLLFYSLTFISCSGQQSNLSKLCAEIRNAPQTVFPNKGQDKKIKLIRELKRFNSDEVCDSLKAIFLSFDTTKRGYWEYKYEPLYILSEKNTPKSLLVLSEIIRDYQLDFPADMYFIWELVSKTENVSVMFPNLTKSLGKQKWTDGHILMMIVNANRKGHLSREQLTNSKEYLINFYGYLKVEKDSLPGSKHYAEYYDSHLTDLLLCLRIFPSEEKINQVYQDVLIQNSSFNKFCSVGSAEYNNESKRKITALFQATAGLLQNNQTVDEKHLELIAAEPLYHNEFYEELAKMNKQSLFPRNYLGQEFFAVSDLAYSKENSRDDGLPDCLNFLSKREIASGDNKGIYYFYQSKYDDEAKDILIEVSGPQPMNQTEFTLTGKKTNKVYFDRCAKNQVEQKINDVLKKLTD